MKKLIATIALLAATTAPAMAESCTSLKFRFENATSTFVRNTDALQAQVEVAVNAQTEFHAVTAARMISYYGAESLGNLKEIDLIVARIEKSKNRCGVPKSAFDAVKNTTEVKTSIKNMMAIANEALQASN